MNPFTQKPSLGSLPRTGRPDYLDRPLSLDMLGKGDLWNYGSDKSIIATNNGATPINGPDGGGALSFDGTTQDVTVISNFGLSLFGGLVNGFTISIRVLVSAGASGYHQYISKSDAGFGGEDGFSILHNSDTGDFRFYVDGDFGAAFTVSVTKETWTTYTVTFSADNTAKIYVDGVLVYTDSRSNPSGSLNPDIMIGQNISSSFPHEGSISQCSIYTYAQRLAQIQQITNDPWQAYRREKIALIAAATGGVTPATSVNLLDGLFERKRLIA